MRVSVLSWTAELSSRSLLLASCNQYKLLVNFDNTWTKKKCHVLSSPIKRDMSQKQQLGGWSHIALLHIDNLDPENWGLGVLERRADVSKKGFEKKKHSEKRRETGKMKVKILAGRKILEVILETKDLTKDPCGDECQGTPRSVTTKTGQGEQWHSRNQLDFLPDCPEPAATSPLERDGKI